MGKKKRTSTGTPKRTGKRGSRSSVVCPFCGEAEDLYVDLGGGRRQTYTEDCAVCCRPRIVHVEPLDPLGDPLGDPTGEVRVWVERGE
jgi:hypothetical protein